jgi:hypothetical protein
VALWGEGGTKMDPAKSTEMIREIKQKDYLGKLLDKQRKMERNFILTGLTIVATSLILIWLERT